MNPASLTWIGHATALLEVGGFRLLTDPLLRHRVAHLRRYAGREPATPAVDAVLVSHAHMDHLHAPSLRLVDADVPVVAPRGTVRLLQRAGRREIIEVAVGDRVTIGPATITAVPAAHPHGRGPHSRVRAEPLGYVIAVGDHRTYFAGDTDLFDEMGALGPVHLALLPIWGWGPSIGVGHLDPERAVEAARRVRADLVVPIHWGTFAPMNLRRAAPVWLHQPAEAFTRAAAAHGVTAALLHPGQAHPL